MRQEQANALIATMATNYQVEMDQAQKALYSEFFRKIDYEQGKYATNRALEESRFLPRIAELNAYVGERTGGDDREEAEVEYCLRTYRGITRDRARGLVRERRTLLAEFNRGADDPNFDIVAWEQKWDSLTSWLPVVEPSAST